MNTTLRLLIIGVLVTSFACKKDQVDRTTRPVAKPAPEVNLPTIQKVKLSNGLAVWLVERHLLPTVAFNLVIQSGSDHDPQNLPGVASMTADMLDEGTKSRDALQIADELESLGASLGVNSGWDGTTVALNTLSKYLEKALAVMCDVVTNPTFPQKEFERLRAQRLTSLLQQRDQPTTIASNAFSYILYGSGHPYGANPAGNESSVKSMNRENLVKFYQAYYRPNNATLIVVGDTEMKSLMLLLEKMLSGWKGAPVAPVTIPEPRGIETMKVYLVDKPGAPQSEIRIGYPALARSTPDYFPVIVMNRMLGGQFTSRINLNLREKHGFTYGARSGFSFLKAAGPFTASAGVVTEKTDSSVREFLNEINLMKDQGMKADELEFVKKGLIGSFALTFETPAQIAGALQSIVLYNLPEDYYQSYLQNIEKVTLEDVARVSKKYLESSHMAVLVVGDLSKIRGSVSDLKLGDVVVCDVEGKPLK